MLRGEFLHIYAAVILEGVNISQLIFKELTGIFKRLFGFVGFLFFYNSSFIFVSTIKRSFFLPFNGALANLPLCWPIPNQNAGQV